MKHNIKITAILILMFFITQLIGIGIVGFYNSPDNILPYGMEPPAEIQEKPQGFSIIFAFVLAIALFFILTKINAEKLIRTWFFAVTIIALGFLAVIYVASGMLAKNLKKKAEKKKDKQKDIDLKKVKSLTEEASSVKKS